MTKAFTIYWTPDGWQGIGEGNPITTAGGSDFSTRIAPGDRVFVTNILNGQLRVVGAFDVQKVVIVSESGKPPGATWDAPEFLVARDGSSVPLRPRPVPHNDVKRLGFVASDGRVGSVALKSDGSVNGQAMRAVRELTSESAAILSALADSSLNREWSKNELQASVSASLEIASKKRQGFPLASDEEPERHAHGEPSSTQVSQRSSKERLPAEVLSRATPEYIWSAVQKLLGGEVEHPFGPSTDYDLIADGGHRLPPKAVFGIGLSLALGRSDIQPKHFSGGESSTCFRLLRAAGFEVVPKGEQVSNQTHEDSVESPEEWKEGRLRLVAHNKRERAKGLSKAKKAQFRRLHGRLTCEQCGLNPVEHYGSEFADACIEVHHSTTQVCDMSQTHVTTLEDLQCLCANCHRLIHKKIVMETLDRSAAPLG